MDKIAVLIPCYNESKTVEKVVTDFRRVLPDATIYVYDNNSTDGTAELAAKAGDVYKRQTSGTSKTGRWRWILRSSSARCSAARW